MLEGLLINRFLEVHGLHLPQFDQHTWRITTRKFQNHGHYIRPQRDLLLHFKSLSLRVLMMHDDLKLSNLETYTLPPQRKFPDNSSEVTFVSIPAN
jgi:hypothetical protein